MIAWFISRIMTLEDETLSTGSFLNRVWILIILLITCFLFFVIVLIALKRRRIHKITALILSVFLIVESAGLINSLRGRIRIPLEYVCAVETSRNDHHEYYDPIWRTSCYPDSTTVPKETIEKSLGCSLANVEFDEEYTYLFVYYYKDVELTCSFWDRSTFYLDDTESGEIAFHSDSFNEDPTKGDLWLGKLSAHGEDADNTIFVFRFPRRAVLSEWEQWLI